MVNYRGKEREYCSVPACSFEVGWIDEWMLIRARKAVYIIFVSQVSLFRVARTVLCCISAFWCHDE